MMVLAFALADELYAVDILTVQEIRVWEGATRLPGTPSWLRGVFNLRGEILPVVDLRERLGMPLLEGGRPVVIVFRQRERTAGVIVDAVLDVHTLPDELQPSPAAAEFVRGLAAVEGEQMLILLDVPDLLEASLGEVEHA